MESVLHALSARVEADITSSLGMKTTTELCHSKCQHIQACSHNRAGIVIYIIGVGGAKTEGDGNPVQCQCGKLHSSRNDKGKNKNHIHII